MIGLIVFVFGCVPTACANRVPPVVVVATDGSGDYNCDGISDQEEINQALDFVATHPEYTTVHLKGPNTFWIDEPIFISADTILEGDTDAVIKLIDNAGWWTRFKPLIGQKGLTYTLALGDPDTTTGNITIRGFEIDGNRHHQAEPSGNSFYNLIRLQNCYNISIHDMYLHDSLADIIQTGYDLYGFDINSQFYNNRIHASGHDGLYLGNVTNFRIHDNIITDSRTDAGVRMQYCNHFKVYNNIIGNDPDRQFSGGIGVTIQADGDTPLDDAEVYGNYIFGKGYYHGIWLWHIRGGGELNTHRNVHIHHNVISSSRQAGIGIYGFNNTLIENNVMELNGEGGVVFYQGDPVNNVSGFVTTVRNNIIINNGTYGIDNQVPSAHTFISQYNCIAGNSLGDYHNASSTTDIHADPLFAHDNAYYYDNYANITYHILAPRFRIAEETGDFRSDLGTRKAWAYYHLRSEGGRWDGTQWVLDNVTSPCIDSGDPTADASGEPCPGGERINIGAFGNTATASKAPQQRLVHLGWDLNTDPGWLTQGQWAWGQPTGQGGGEGGSPDPTGGATGTHVYGVNLDGDYSVDTAGDFSLTAGPFDLSNFTDATLHFQRWLNSDTVPAVADSVEVSLDGTNWQSIWSNGEPEYYSQTVYCLDPAWTRCVYGLGTIADRQPRVYLRWRYQVQVPGAVPGSGWNIDDVEIRGRRSADINSDGVVNSQDFIAFLQAWSAHQPLADWNDDSDINTVDFILFLNDWVTGC